MKKSFLLFSITALIAGSMVGGGRVLEAKADEQPIPNQITNLIFNYFGASGYTKKTTIGLNDAAINDLSDCFHCGQTAKKRTTYYRDDKLLLAAEDGTVPMGSGAYIYDGYGKEVKRAEATEEINMSNYNEMWNKLSSPVSVGHTEATCLEDYYVTLKKFADNSDTYFQNWGKSENGVYYYDLTSEDKTKDENSVYNCQVWNDFLYFCAPMLYKNSGYYFAAKSLTITTKLNSYGEEYLCFDMYIDDIDSGKLECNYLAEARIYHGNGIFQESIDKAFHLLRTDGSKRMFDVDPNNNTHLVLNDVKMIKGEGVKVWDTERNYHGFSQCIEHNLSVGVSADTGFVDAEDNYVIPESGLYDFYIDFNQDGSYKKLYVEDKSAMTIYVSDGGWQDIDGKRMWARYYDKNENELTIDEYKPNFVDSHTNSLGEKVHKITIPGEAKYIQICYNKTTNEYVYTKKLEIKYDQYNAFYFKDWNSGNETISFGTWNYPEDRLTA